MMIAVHVVGKLKVKIMILYVFNHFFFHDKESYPPEVNGLCVMAELFSFGVRKCNTADHLYLVSLLLPLLLQVTSTTCSSVIFNSYVFSYCSTGITSSLVVFWTLNEILKPSRKKKKKNIQAIELS